MDYKDSNHEQNTADTTNSNPKSFDARLLMITTLMISGCSIIYEVLISSVSSYLVGDSIRQFSITIGLYMSAMGIGSYISRYVKKRLFDWFVFIEIAVGIIGGLTTIILFMAHIYLETYMLIMYVHIILIGILVGLEIPLLTRIIEENSPNLRMTLSTLFSFDYIGGLIGSIAFPLVLLPQLGYFTTSFLTGSINIAVALVIVLKYKSSIKRGTVFTVISVISLVIMFLGTIFSSDIARNIESNLYRDQVVFSKQTKYQKIVMTKHKDDLRLFINGNLQFSSSDEYRYHESLVHIPMMASANKENILVLGGGDGLAVREILKYDEVDKITLVDLDDEMVNLCKNDKQVTKINEGALSSSKLEVIITDAYKYLEECREYYDVIIIDLPDPNNEGLNKLYTNVFYRLASNRLSKGGVMSVQSTSPYYASEAFWCINKTIREEGLNVEPYHIQVPSFGDWGFNLASKEQIDISNLEIEVPTRFLNQDVLDSMFNFAEDEKIEMDNIISNTLSKPQLIEYYLEAVERWR